MTTPTIQAQVLSLAPVNVIMYGAKGDGVTVDTAALVAASAAAVAAGVSVYLPPGRYITTEWASLASIIGAGQFETTIVAAPGTTSSVVSVTGDVGSPVVGWSISGVTIDGSSLEGGAQNLRLTNVTNAVVEDCGFINSSQHGIYGANCININVRNNYVFNCGMSDNAHASSEGIGINLVDSGGFIFNNTINNTGGAGIGHTAYITGAELGDIEIASNRVFNSGIRIAQDNITVYDYRNQHIKVHHNYCHTSNNANIHAGSTYVEVTNNECYFSNVTGISVATRVPGTFDLLVVPSVIISGNIITSPKLDGIRIDVPCQAVISDNIINKPTGIGINITGNGRQVSVHGNIVNYPGSHGLKTNGVTDTTISGNVLTLLSLGSVATIGSITPGSGYTPNWISRTTAASGNGAKATLTYAIIPSYGGSTPVVGNTVTIAGVTPTGYNGTYIVTDADLAAKTFSYACAAMGDQTIAGTVFVGTAETCYPNVPLTGGTGDGATADIWVTYDGAIAGISAATTGASGTGTDATVSFSGTSAPPVGTLVTISGVTPSTYNGTYTVTASSVSGGVVSVSYASTATGAQTASGTITGGGVVMRDLGKGYNATPATLTGLVATGSVVTVTFSGSVAVPVGAPIVISGCTVVTGASYNGTHIVTASSVGGGVVSVSYASTVTSTITALGVVTGVIPDTLTAPAASIGGTGSGFSFPVASVYGTPAGYCYANSAPTATGQLSSSGVIVANNTFTGGVQAIGQSDPGATLIIGTNTVRNNGTGPFFLQESDVVIGQTGFGGENIGFATGSSVLATGDYAEAWGFHAASKTRTGFRAHASGCFSVTGDAQRGSVVLRGQTFTGTACVLTADQSAFSGHNAVNLNDPNTAMGFSGRVLVSDATSTNAARWSIEGMYGSNSTGDAVAFLGSVTTTLLSSKGLGSGWTIAVTAESTGMGLRIAVTAATGCFAVARVDTEELIFA